MDIGLYIHTVCRRFVSMEIHGFYCQYGGCAVCKVVVFYLSGFYKAYPVEFDCR